jgi:hypothetical protein
VSRLSLRLWAGLILFCVRSLQVDSMRVEVGSYVVLKAPKGRVGRVAAVQFERVLVQEIITWEEICELGLDDIFQGAPGQVLLLL